MRTTGLGARWPSVAAWGLLTVATVYLTVPVASVSTAPVAAARVAAAREAAAPAPYASFDALRFNGQGDALPE